MAIICRERFNNLEGLKKKKGLNILLHELRAKNYKTLIIGSCILNGNCYDYKSANIKMIL